MLYDPPLFHVLIDSWFTFVEARSVTVVVFLRENAQNVGVYDSHGYTPKRRQGFNFRVRFHFDCLLIRPVPHVSENSQKRPKVICSTLSQQHIGTVCKVFTRIAKLLVVAILSEDFFHLVIPDKRTRCGRI